MTAGRRGNDPGGGVGVHYLLSPMTHQLDPSPSPSIAATTSIAAAWPGSVGPAAADEAGA